MKTFSLLVTILVASLSVCYCQSDSLSYKKIMLGGNLGFNSGKFNDYYEYEEKELTFNIKPVFGYFVSKSVAIGASFDFMFVEDDESEWETNAEKNLSVMIFARYNGRITNKFKFYIEPYIGRKYYLLDEESEKIKEWFVKTDFGLLYFINESFSIELKVAGLSYERQTIKDTDTLYKIFNMTYDIVKPNIGLRYYF